MVCNIESLSSKSSSTEVYSAKVSATMKPWTPYTKQENPLFEYVPGEWNELYQLKDRILENVG